MAKRTYRETRKEGKKAHVFDLINAGPRNRFLIRNAAGDVFISHNSAGHGLNLQFGGNEIVWFGLTDNLRFYRQLNARLRRMGQTAPNVHIRRIIAKDTIDEALSDLLQMKQAGAQELRKAVERYRKLKGG